MNNLEEQLKIALATKGERAATEFLKNNPLIVFWSFCKTGGHSKYVINEFEFGNKYRADFVALLSYSYVWEIHFVELENTDDMVITKDGRPSKRFNSAISQIDDWREYIANNKRLVQEDLAIACKKKDLLKLHDSKWEPSNDTGNKLKNPESFIRFYYHIIIGRRDSITPEARRRMNQRTLSEGLTSVGTFDRFLDIARNMDKSSENPDSRILLTKTEGL